MGTATFFTVIPTMILFGKYGPAKEQQGPCSGWHGCEGVFDDPSGCVTLWEVVEHECTYAELNIVQRMQRGLLTLYEKERKKKLQNKQQQHTYIVHSLEPTYFGSVFHSFARAQCTQSRAHVQL